MIAAADIHEALRSLAHPARRELFDILRSSGEKNVSALVALTGLSQSSVSQHLKRLKKARLVVERSQSTFRFYRMHPDAMGMLRAFVRPPAARAPKASKAA